MKKIKPYIEICLDGARVRMNNKRITFKQRKNHFNIWFESISDVINDERSPVEYRLIRGRLMITQINLSEESLDALVAAYLQYKLNKETDNS